MRRVVPVVVAVVAVLGLVPVSPANAAETHTVYMSNGQFCSDPVCPPPPGGAGAVHELTIARGDTVEWVFADGLCYAADVVFPVLGGGAPMPCHHDTVALGSQWDSGPMSVQDGHLRFSVTFDDRGSFEYFCTVHAEATNMRGNIVVE